MRTDLSTRLVNALKQRRFSFVDIGARAGLPPHWREVADLLEVVAFEPDVEEARRLGDTLRSQGAEPNVISSAVWDVAGRQFLHLTRSPGCSSLFPPAASFIADFPDASRFDVLRKAEIETVRLDDALGSGTGPQFLKIDAQGGALPILKGAPQTLSGLLGVEAEVELVPLYEGEPLFGDVDAFIRPLGFELIDLRPVYWRKQAARTVAGTRGQLIFADALYVRSPRSVAAQVEASPEEGRAHLCASAVVIGQVYALTDWLVSCAFALDERGIAGTAIHEAAAAARTSGDWRFRYPLGLWLKDLGDWLMESSPQWTPSESRIGNRRRVPRGTIMRKLFGGGTR